MFTFSHGESPSPKRPRRDRRDLDVFAAGWKWLGPVHTSFSHGASLPPNRPGHNRRDSGVSAAVWEWLNPCLSCPLFVYEQGITISVCVQIC